MILRLSLLLQVFGVNERLFIWYMLGLRGMICDTTLGLNLNAKIV